MCQSPSAVMIFAAGFGTRMRPLTDKRPKPLIEVAGRPLIDHALDFVKEISPKTIVANLHYMPEALESYLTPRGVVSVREEPEILDTGGGLRNALPQLGDGPVFTINSDAIWVGPNPLKLLMKAWQPDRMDALMCIVPVSNSRSYLGDGDFTMDGNKRLTRGGGWVYGGAQIVKTEGLHQFSESIFSLNRIWDQMQVQERLFGVSYPGLWCDVGQPGGIPVAEDMLAQADV
ncbi:MAG: nucleotidyltransferase family protein [Pseudomonadota bacterium]